MEPMGVFGSCIILGSHALVIGCSVACIAVGARQNSIVGSCKIASEPDPLEKPKLSSALHLELSACGQGRIVTSVGTGERRRG